MRLTSLSFDLPECILVRKTIDVKTEWEEEEEEEEEEEGGQIYLRVIV